MSPQYDKLSDTYEVMKTIPHHLICHESTQRILGDVSGLNILDLACGTGYYSTLFLDWGAAHVIGIDISNEMIKAAKAALAQTPERADRLEYYVGDVGKPDVLRNLNLSDRKFDLVHGAWLLNYAATSAELAAMWRTIASALKPGGRFVGVIPNIIDPIFGSDLSSHGEKYGIVYELVEKVENGHKSLVRSLTDPPVEFDNYVLNERGLYEKCAREAGMEGVTFEHVAPGEKGETEFPNGFWDEYLRRPLGIICVAIRSSVATDGSIYEES